MSVNIEPRFPAVPRPFGWALLNPPAYLSAALDQVAVGPGGVLAIARWTGHVTVRRGVLHARSAQRAPSGPRPGGPAPEVAEVVLAATRLADRLQPPHAAVTAALIVVPGGARPTRVAPGAVVVGEDRFTATLAGLDRHLGPDDAADIRLRLAAPHDPEEDLPTVATLVAQLQTDRERETRAHHG